jgi:hypothetical protein
MNKAMVELMKLKEKRRERERESKKNRKHMWSGFGFVVTIAFMIAVEEFLFDGHRQYPTFRKWTYGILITLGILCLLISILYLVHICPKNRAEIETLKTKEKQLEQEIEKQ